MNLKMNLLLRKSRFNICAPMPVNVTNMRLGMTLAPNEPLKYVLVYYIAIIQLSIFSKNSL